MHFGGIPNAGHSHLRTMIAFGQELERRGHRFTMFQTRSAEHAVQKAGLATRVIPGDDQAIERLFQQVSAERGASLRAYPEYMRLTSALLAQQAPALLRSSEVDFLLVDQEEPGGSAAADITGISYASICNSLPLNQEPEMPPAFLPWRYSSSWWARARNVLGYRVRDVVIRNVFRTVNAERRRHRLAEYSIPDDSFSTILQVSQTIPEFDFPRKRLPECFYYAGPYMRFAEQKDVPFPFDRLNQRPLIYVYFGGMSGPRLDVVRNICAACASLDAQVVVSLGHSCYPVTDLPGNPIVVDFAPQNRLLTQASLAISHGGLNTTIESLGAGTPMLIIPFTGDQPGIGARVAYTRTGECLPLSQCRVENLALLISRVMSSPEYRRNAALMKSRIELTRGIPGAVDRIEAESERHSRGVPHPRSLP